MSNSLQPHGLWPIRLLCPWSSPGKNTGVGRQPLLPGIFPTQGLNPGLLNCRGFFTILYLQGLKKSEFGCTCVLSHSVVSDSLQSHGLQPTSFLCSWDSPGKDTGVGCHSLLLAFSTNPLSSYTPLVFQLQHSSKLFHSFSFNVSNFKY